MGEQNKKDQDE